MTFNDKGKSLMEETTTAAPQIATEPEAPRIRAMRRPAPVPAGFTAVEIHDTPAGFEGLWYLVKLDPACTTCDVVPCEIAKDIEGDNAYCTKCAVSFKVVRITPVTTVQMGLFSAPTSGSGD